jgi:hypothetical protein
MKNTRSLKSRIRVPLNIPVKNEICDFIVFMLLAAEIHKTGRSMKDMHSAGSDYSGLNSSKGEVYFTINL